MATVAVVLPSMCMGVKIRGVIRIPRSANTRPITMDRISGFLESFLRTMYKPRQIVVFSSR